MVHRIGAARGHLLEIHPEGIGCGLGLFQRPTEGHERRVKRRHVFAQQRRGIALGIHGDEQQLQLLGGLGAHQAQHLGRTGQRRRTHIGALYKAEIQHHHLAAVVRKRSRHPIEIGEGEIAGVVGAGDVNARECVGRGGRIGERIAGCQPGRSPQSEAGHQSAASRGRPPAICFFGIGKCLRHAAS